ncbi:DNA polymerase I [Thalassobacillus pellis]|uniref:DNA polymerase I n=1 Tax=Thalassobacillus pellis TaxID=748008 RepID=UPI0019615A08|nr:DNA polymerase I [Thalassobacillus pellis]MBM7554993.1 DNA polymerase-1 [Thalassobacillus pellis]
MSKKVVLIDGNSIAYRAFFALPLLNNDKGIYTNAVYGFTTILLKILEEDQPSHILVAFDAGKTTFRHKTYEDYKGGREKTPSELSEQFPVLKELLDAFSIPHYQLEQYEADDIIGTLSKSAEEQGLEVNIISGDKDLLQLVSDHTNVTLTRKGITNVERYDPEFLLEKMNIRPDQVIDLKALMGDKSDNIPGVPGVGEKTAVKLLKEFDTLENLYDNLDKVSGKKLVEKLENHKENAFMSKELVTIMRNSPIEVGVDGISYDGYTSQTVTNIFKDLGFQSLLGRVSGSEIDDEEGVTLPEIDVQVIDEFDKAELTGEESVIVEMLHDNYHQADIEGIAISNENNKYFITMENAAKSEIFKNWAEDQDKKKWVFDAKKTVVALLRYGIYMKGIEFDLLLASYLINPSENNHDIPSICHRMGETQVKYDEEVYGRGAKLQVPSEEILAEHLARKADLLFKLKPKAEDQLYTNNQFDLYKDLEMPLALILGEMEHLGVQVDVGRLEAMGDELQTRLKEIEQQVYELAGETFNLNSPKQLGPILFEKLQLPVIKKTKTGYSTSADVLEQLRDHHEIIPKLLIYRQLGKLQSTYIEGLLKVVDKDTKKIHTRFNQALTQTGRLSSTDPNLQNIPIRLEEGRKIRQAFIPSQEGWVIFASDYSQIELRVLAHIAEDEKLIDAFNDGRDIHTQTAMEVFSVSGDEVTANMRRQAKAVNFGIVYGISDFGLSQSLGITRKEAKKFIDRYLESYPGVRDYMEETVSEAKQQGFVTTFMNRKRFLPEINSRNFNRRNAAERTAMNTPIQGSAADIIKKAMIDLHTRLKEEGLSANLLLQVHDELILEAPETEVERLKTVVADVMENTIELKVPLKVDYSYGPTWYDAK